MIIRKRMRSGKVSSKTSNKPTSTHSCSESMENQVSSSGDLEAQQKIQNNLEE